MSKALFTCIAALALGTVSPAFAQTAQSDTKVIQVELWSGRTSDRSPDSPAPARAPGASIFGAAGTEAGQTPWGTSDRTPSHHYQPPTN